MHEAEVGARDLEHEHARSRDREQLGGRPEISGAGSRARVRLDAGESQELHEQRRGGRLAGRPGDADRRDRGTLQHEVAEAADAAAGCTEAPYARRYLRRPDVEERLVVLARVVVEVGVLANPDAQRLERVRLGGGRAGRRDRDLAPLLSEQPGEGDRVRVESLDEGHRPGERSSGRGGAAVPPRPTSGDCAHAPTYRSTVAVRTRLSASAGTRGRRCSSTGRASATSRPSHACRSGSTRARTRANRRRARPSTRRTSSRRRAPGSAR